MKLTAVALDGAWAIGVVDGASGVAISDIELQCEAAVPDIPDAQFQALAENTKRTCLLARATAAVPARLNAHLVTMGGKDS